MKKIMMILVMLWSIPAFSQITSATLTASGLTCSMCSRSIYKALEKVPSVKSVTADVEHSSFAIQFKEGKVSLDDLKKAVQDAGFSVASLQVTATFHNETIGNDAHMNISGNTFHFVHVGQQTLTGDKKLTVIDRNFTSAREHKKYAQYTRMECYETGARDTSCPKDKVTSNRIYHVTL